LVRSNSRSVAYKVWSARFALSLAACESVQADVDYRDRLIGRATAILNRLPDPLQEKPEVQILQREARQMTRQALMAPGN